MLDEKMRLAYAYACKAHDVKTQAEFAQSIDMSADRLKNILHGKIKRLLASEAVAIEHQYSINRAWWYARAAPMLLDEQERAVAPALKDIYHASQEVVELGLDKWQASFVQELLFNLRGKRVDALRNQLSQVGLMVQEPVAEYALEARHQHASRVKKRCPEQTEQTELLQSWSSCSAADKDLILAVTKRLSHLKS